MMSPEQVDKGNVKDLVPDASLLGFSRCFAAGWLNYISEQVNKSIGFTYGFP